ncbi:MAG: nicotinate (nicotinamide) nucleotide adenylyltransferase [Terracidiphilus sp.]|jgi:nicotinate-nucleotide adenylyltransferase
MNLATGRGATGNDELAWQHAMRVAFFGGSFDPPHLGHLAIARAARDAFHLNVVLFAPVGAQPLKPEGAAAGFEDRLAMTRLAIKGEPGFAVSLADAPKTSGGRDLKPNFTLETLDGLRAEFKPETALYCLMGADSFFGLRHWYRAAEIPYVAALIVASRPRQPLDGLKAALPHGLTLEPLPAGDRMAAGIEVRAFHIVNPAGERAPFYLLPGLDVEISATEVREAIEEAAHRQPNAATADSAAVQSMLTAAVAEYIRAHGLYR